MLAIGIGLAGVAVVVLTVISRRAHAKTPEAAAVNEADRSSDFTGIELALDEATAMEWDDEL